MSNFNAIYKEFINDKNAIKPEQMAKGKFYLIKQYEYIDGDKKNFSDTTSPIIFVLYVSKPKDIVHAVKVSNINPNVVKKLFGKLIDEKTEKIKLKGGPSQVYEKVVGKMPSISNDSYRTYKLSGIKKVVLLEMDVAGLVPKNKLKKDKK